MISSYQPFTFSTLKDSYRLLLIQSPCSKAPFTNLYSSLSAGVAEINLFNGILVVLPQTCQDKTIFLHTWDWMYCLPRCEAFFSCTVMKTARWEASLPSLPQACTTCHLVFARPVGSKMQSCQIKDMAELGLADRWIASKVKRQNSLSSWQLWFMSVVIKMLLSCFCGE